MKIKQLRTDQLRTDQFQTEQLRTETILKNKSRLNLESHDYFTDKILKDKDIALLLLKVHLDIKLSEKDEEILSQYNSKGTTTFIIKNKKFIYPTGKDLFPFNIIESAVNQGGPAIFTQNYLKGTGKVEIQCKIVSTLLSSTLDEKIIIGLLGKGLPYRNFSEEDNFMKTANYFRQIEQKIQSILSQIKNSLNEKNSKIIIERDTGEIIAVNSKAIKQFNISPDKIIGKSLDKLKKDLSPHFINSKISMEDISSDYLNLAVVSLEKDFNEDKKEFNISSYAFENIRSHSNNIILASSHLMTNSDQKHNKNHFIHLISQEAEKINHILTQTHIITNYPDIPLTEQNLIVELEKAVNFIETSSNKTLDKSIVNNTKDTNIFAPAGIYQNIFEQIINVHENYIEETSNQQITISQPEQNKIRISFVTLLSDKQKKYFTTDKTINLLYNFLKKLNIPFKHEIDRSNMKIITTLTIRMDQWHDIE